MPDPNIMPDGYPVGFTPLEKVIVILAQTIRFDATNRVVLHRAPCGVVAWFNACRIGDGTHLTNCRPDDMAILSDIRPVAHRTVFKHRAAA